MVEGLARKRRSSLYLSLPVLLGGLLALSMILAVRLPTSAAHETQPEAWQTAAPLIPARYDLGAASVAFDGGYYVVGGSDQQGAPLARLDRYDPTADAWEALRGLPQPLSQVGVAGLGFQIHAVGGQAENGQPVNSHKAYSPSQGSWRSLAPYPAARRGVAVVASGGYLYAIGGINANGSSSSELWRYELGENRWTSLAPMPYTAGLSGAAAIDGRVFVVGGIRGSEAISDFVRYDPEFNSWFLGPPIPRGRMSPTVLAAGNYLYVFGGGWLVSGDIIPWPNAYRYDVSRFPNAVWEPVDTLGLYPLVGSGGVCVDGAFWVVGGFDVDGQASQLNHVLDLEGQPCKDSGQRTHLPIVPVRAGRDAPRSGVWVGSTEHGGAFGFVYDVTTNSLAAGTLAGEFLLDTCQVAAPAMVQYAVPDPVPVDLDTFSFVHGAGMAREISGTFLSLTEAEGGYHFDSVLVAGHGFCSGSGSWQAAWQPEQ